MAVTPTLQKIIDNNNRALLKYTYISDGTDQSNTIILDAGSLFGALNVNNYVIGAATDRKSNYRTYIKRIFGNSKANGYHVIQWQGTTNSAIVTFNNGVFDYSFDSMGGGALITNPEASPTGNILFSSLYNKLGDTLTLFIDLKKDNQDFSAGQDRDPAAFNKGPAQLR